MSRFLLFILLFSCSSAVEKERVMNHDKLNYEQVIKYLEMYNTDEDIKLYMEGERYAVEDSLSKYLSKMNIDSLYCDEEFEFLMGNLLEKRYLSATRIIPSKYIKTTLVYNAASLNMNRASIQSFLNHLSGFKKGVNNDYREYAFSKKDFVCIDSVVLKLNNNIYLKNDSIHKVCMKLVEQKKTGGCLW